jgi:GT2 family glycosyltransferase
MKSVSIIIPNWNGQDLLRSYLPSVLEAKAKYKGRAEVIVVDDASTDSSAKMLRRDFADIKLIVHEHNKGFGPACWSGALAAVHPVLIFLNSDVEVNSAFIEPLADSFNNPDIFAASPLIFDEDGKLSNVTISIPYFRRGKLRYKSFSPQLLLNNAPSLPNPWYTLFPLGGAFAVDRQRFIALQGFDELFHPFYYEDTDLGLRAWRRGWQCIVVPGSCVTHMHQGTIARSIQQFKIKSIRKRNRLLFLWKNFTSARMLGSHIFFQILRLCYRPFRLDGMIHVATILAIPSFPKAMRRRRAEKIVAVYSEDKIFEIISSANMQNRQKIESTLR